MIEQVMQGWGTYAILGGIAAVSGCAGLLGVLLGWWLRGKEVISLKEELAVKQEFKIMVGRKMGQAGASKVDFVIMDEPLEEKVVKGPHAHVFSRMNDICLYCPITRGVWEREQEREECGVIHPVYSHLVCSKPEGHYVKDTDKHGYAGQFWNEVEGQGVRKRARCGSVHPEKPGMTCTRPPGHRRELKHAYAGEVWE